MTQAAEFPGSRLVKAYILIISTYSLVLFSIAEVWLQIIYGCQQLHQPEKVALKGAHTLYSCTSPGGEASEKPWTQIKERIQGAVHLLTSSGPSMPALFLKPGLAPKLQPSTLHEDCARSLTS